jgi:CRP-like cAMP-binding protein
MANQEVSCEGSPLYLEVIEAGNCPLGYKPGDKFRIAYPAINPPTDKQLCFLALGNAHTAIKDFMDKKSDACFECSACFKNKVKFQLFDAPKNNQLHALIAEQLKGFSLFRLMRKAELEMIARDIHLKKYQEGDKIIDVGEIGENFFIIHVGNVDIFGQDKRSPEKFNNLITLGPEDCFGEMSLLTNEPCSTRVIAKTKCTLLAIEKNAFQRMIQESQAINKYFFSLLASRIKNTNDKVSQQNLVGGIAGSLSALSLVEIVQIFKSSASTGILHLKSNGNNGKIEINRGEIFSAEYLSFKNEEAFFALVRLKEGEFQFERNAGPFEKRIKIPTTGLLMESMRVMDEVGK